MRTQNDLYSNRSISKRDIYQGDFKFSNIDDVYSEKSVFSHTQKQLFKQVE